MTVAPHRTVRPAAAIGFYPGDAASCGRQIDELVSRVELPDDLPGLRLGGLVPHAGWRYSGFTAAHLYLALAQARRVPEVVVLLGAVHRRGVRQATLWDGDAWWTPLGEVPVDRALGGRVIESGKGAVVAGRDAHAEEHSLEVQVPMVRRLLPGAAIVPIQLPPDDRAPAVGRRIASAIREDGRAIAVVASSDLTHYGSRYGFAPVGDGLDGLEWTRANDRRLVDQALGLSATGVLDEAARNHNACGAGALAGALAAVAELGATSSVLLHQCTSYDSAPSPGADLFVGYASILFGR